MKLLHYTFQKLSWLLFLLMAIWGVLFYYAIVDEVMDETDDTLENYSKVLIREALINEDILKSKEEASLISFYSFRRLADEEVRSFQEHYYDSTIYIESEDEYEPVRVLETCFQRAGGEYYRLTIMVSILERDDMVEAILLYLCLLYFLFLLVQLWVRKLCSRVCLDLCISC